MPAVTNNSFVVALHICTLFSICCQKKNVSDWSQNLIAISDSISIYSDRNSHKTRLCSNNFIVFNDSSNRLHPAPPLSLHLIPCHAVISPATMFPTSFWSACYPGVRPCLCRNFLEFRVMSLCKLKRKTSSCNRCREETVSLRYPQEKAHAATTVSKDTVKYMQNSWHCPYKQHTHRLVQKHCQFILYTYCTLMICDLTKCYTVI